MKHLKFNHGQQRFTYCLLSHILHQKQLHYSIVRITIIEPVIFSAMSGSVCKTHSNVISWFNKLYVSLLLLVFHFLFNITNFHFLTGSYPAYSNVIISFYCYSNGAFLLGPVTLCIRLCFFNSNNSISEGKWKWLHAQFWAFTLC